ncbi:MAG TPA: hypothetical protein VEK07_03070 [Polyangiaceae bacterium]|nr:hypothetical protein [Polyangiaceae bacterium]
MNRLAAALASLVGPAALATLSPTAVAEGPSRTVVVLQMPAADEVTTEARTRVQGELEAAGFRVVLLPSNRENAEHDVETAGDALSPLGAFAIFARSEEGGAVAEIWVSDRLRQKTVIQRASLAAAHHERQSEILAVRAVELLRASFAEFWMQPKPQPAISPTPPEPRRPESRSVPPNPDSPSRVTAFAAGVGVGAGVGMLDGLRDSPPLWVPAARISYGWESGFSIGVAFHGLGPAATLDAPAGTAKVEEQLATADLAKTWWPRWPVVPFVCGGIGAQHVHVSGSAAAPYAGETADDWALVTDAGLGAAVPLRGGFSVVIETRGVLAWPPTVVRIAQGDAGFFGAPSVLVDAGILGVVP